MLRALIRAACLALAATRLSAQVVVPPACRALLRPPVFAAAPDPLHESGQNVTISLLTVSTGPALWQMFGHTAIWIHDNLTQRDSVFNWGMFDFHQPNFIPHFLKGLNIYQMGGQSINDIVYENCYYNRSVVSQELDLTAAQKDAILEAIRVNARPENLTYRYDYFRDNCSTRPRDIIDRALGGIIRSRSQTLTGTTYRSQALRLMQSDKPLVTGVDIGLGEPSDHELTQWEAMFLPMQLHDFIANLRVTDSTGAAHPLVRSETVLFRSTRGPDPAGPPNMNAWLWPLGLVIAALLGWLVLRAQASRGVRLAAAIALCTWCVIAGLLGVILTALWTVTDHMFAHANENLLVFNPLWLVLAVLIVRYVWSGRAVASTRIVALVVVGLDALALLAHVVGLSRQNNLAVIGLALLPAMAIAWGTMRDVPVRETGASSAEPRRTQGWTKRTETV